MARSEEIPVLDENAPALRVFLASQTQWRHGFGGATGLDYTAVIAVIKLFRMRNVERVFEHVRDIEYAALKELQRRAEKDKT